MSGSHTYAAARVYPVAVTVTDNGALKSNVVAKRRLPSMEGTASEDAAIGAGQIVIHVPKG